MTNALLAPVSARLRDLPAWVVVTQVFIGLGWLRAAAEKLIDLHWWAGDGISEFLSAHDEMTVGWYVPIAEVVDSQAVIVAVVVLAAQLVAGLALVAGRFVGVGLAVGIFLNLNFVAAGAVNPSAFYLLSQGALVLWSAERRGGDHGDRSRLVAAAVGGATVAVVSVPFIHTLHPAAVVDDPAVMLVLVGSLTFLACDMVHRRVTGGRGLP